ncbi:McrC family protein [Paracoccus methylarcula]|uniref:Calmodulin-binding protein n=1 Tax=Paracoccus methylarcula TaxID=72022 RepID=A0A422R1H9_9RHOB|nr:calmodulin-binding protein [Paracoccus methylarcula]RNF36062.1 calmodulin-binding protein [Paracoccus methylarcula]
MWPGRHHYTVPEWSFLPVGPEGITELQAEQLHLAAISAARRLGVPENGVLARGFRRLETRQVCGIIAAPGISLEILPKLKDDDGALRATLIRMLTLAFDVPLSEGQITGLSTQDNDLLEVFIDLFVTRLAQQVQTGLMRAYVPKEELLPKLRGNLDLRQQILRRAIDPSRLHCRFEEFSENTPLNRLFKTCLLHVGSFARTEPLRRRITSLTERFAGIPQSRAPLKERIVWNRLNERFRDTHTLARMLLEAVWQNTTYGTFTGVALLFPMNLLFERYVSRWLQRVLPAGTVSVQRRTYTLLQHGAYPLIPDIVIETDAGPLIVDTKWKDLGDPIGSVSKVSQADLYQLASYGAVYDASRVILLYPGTAQDRQPTVWQYTATDRQIEIWLVDLRATQNRKDWEMLARQLVTQNYK